MAPLAPFVSEQIYRNLELHYRPDAPRTACTWRHSPRLTNR